MAYGLSHDESRPQTGQATLANCPKAKGPEVWTKHKAVTISITRPLTISHHHAPCAISITRPLTITTRHAPTKPS